ncbi:MAG: phosphatase PAP2 family protein [Bacilli bacterium]|nr:phosphatase PAP2 family protein [Bacilli bacterium]
MKKYRWVIFTISILMFACMAFLVTNNMSSFIDSGVYRIVTFYKNDVLTTFFKIITFFASEYGIIFMTFLLFLLIRNKKYCVLIMGSAFITVAINYLLKYIFMRSRPFDLMIIEETGFSFPSGHAMVSIGFYGYIIYVIRHLNIDIKYKKIITILIGLLILFIGTSRIYLGVHYPTDIIAGYSCATALLILYIEFTRRFVNENNK